MSDFDLHRLCCEYPKYLGHLRLDAEVRCLSFPALHILSYKITALSFIFNQNIFSR